MPYRTLPDEGLRTATFELMAQLPPAYEDAVKVLEYMRDQLEWRHGAASFGVGASGSPEVSPDHRLADDRSSGSGGSSPSVRAISSVKPLGSPR